MKQKALKYCLFGFMLILIFLPHVYLPWLQKEFPVLQAQRLQGAYEATKKPNFWVRKWLKGEYQKGYETYVRDRNVISPFMLRLKTQTDYLLFNTIPHQNILLGENREFYTKSDCEAYVGLDFKGRAFFADKLKKLEFIANHFKVKGIPFFVFSPPGKPSVVKDNLPPFYKNYPQDSTNRKVFLSLLEDSGIPFLDFEFLIDHQDTSSYDLFGQASLHWSHFAYAMAADTMSAFIWQQTGVVLPQLQWRDSIIMMDQYAGMDKELISGANFLWQPKIEDMPYPVLRFSSDRLSRKPRILSVGDSFYLSWYNGDVHHGFFDKHSKFLYYHNEVYPSQHNNGSRVYAHDLDILQEIESAEMVLITVYESNLNKFAYNFIEKVYGLIVNSEK